MVKTQNETYIKQGSLLVPQKSPKFCIALESLQILQLPPPLKWHSDIYPSFLFGFGPILSFYTAFLNQFSYFFSVMWAMLGYFSALLPLHHSLQFEIALEPIWPSEILSLALIGCVDPERWILPNQIRVPGWTHRQWIFSQLICILFYCQIIMTILANTPKK